MVNARTPLGTRFTDEERTLVRADRDEEGEKGELSGRLVWVPGAGQVDWEPARLDQHARTLADSHVPDRPLIAIRRLWGIPYPIRQPTTCVSCGRPWMCPEASWAMSHLTTLSAAVRRLRRVHPVRTTGTPNRNTG